MARRFGAVISILSLMAVPAESRGQANGAGDTVQVAPAPTYVRDRGARDALARDLQALVARRLPGTTAPFERKTLLSASRAAAMTLGQWQRVVDLTREIRALEPKPAMRQLEGFVVEAIARANLRPGRRSRRFRSELAAAASRLDGAVVAQSLRMMRAQYYLLGENTVRAQIEGRIASNIAAQRGTTNVRLASDLLEQLFALDRVVPQLQTIEDVLSRRLSRPDMRIEDRWAPRQIELNPTLPLNEVVIGIWDSGVDPDVLGSVLWRNPNEMPNGRDDDGNGFVDDIHGFAFDAERRPTTGLLAELPGGSPAAFERLARYSIGWADLDAGDVTEDARFARSIAQSLTAEQRAAFELDLQRLSLVTHGTGIASIAAAGNPAARIMVGRLSYGIGQVPPVIDEASVAARIAYADRAIAYFQANGARIVNMSFRLTLPNVEASLASVESDPVRRRERALRIYNSLHEGFERAVRSAPGILFLAGAGNANENNDEIRSFPAGIRAENLITVGAVDARLEAADISSFGDSVDVYARGVSVPQKLVGGRTIRFTGTSSATPQVSNLAAKLLALCPSLTVRTLRGTILATATLEGAQRLRVIHPSRALRSLREGGCRS